MSPEKKLAIGAAAFLAISFMVLVFRQLPKRLKQEKFKRKWRALQSRCSDSSQWAAVIKDADELLDEALRKKRVKGKTMGERLVSAQKRFSDNDSVWYGHKLRKKIEAEPGFELRKEDVQRALFGLLQGLKDIGAL